MQALRLGDPVKALRAKERHLCRQPEGLQKTEAKQ